MNPNFKEFLRITKKLNEKNIIPLLMGSVGLEYLTKVDWAPSDIDIQVKGDPRGWEAPDEERIHDWDLISTVMENLNYDLIDLHEHEFSNGTYNVEFGVMDTLPSFAGVHINELELVYVNDVKFYLPNVEQYLKIYQSSYQDSYRVENNNHKDLKKIKYLQELIS
ncbi:phosphoribosylanthranilate isomerase [Amphibacillus sp. Q70]|uniref:phosphoribosylanthranilate isomerase n=1 Tax=Amphibacillus sp. Q70 TaxID=3453416 RepID=UPI003F8777E7